MSSKRREEKMKSALFERSSSIGRFKADYYSPMVNPDDLSGSFYNNKLERMERKRKQKEEQRLARERREFNDMLEQA